MIYPDTFFECKIPKIPSFVLLFQYSNWRKIRHIVHWTPFKNQYKDKQYEWVQLAGHSGNFRSGKDQVKTFFTSFQNQKLCCHFEKLANDYFTFTALKSTDIFSNEQ